MSIAIPYGEADFLLGLDEMETLRAVASDPMLRVTQGDRTCVIANISKADEEADDDRAVALREATRDALRGATRTDGRMMEDFASACRTWFHTDRVADVAMLGAAFQFGFVPVSLEAMESAVQLAEARGYGRSREAFEFGRRLAVDSDLLEKHEDEVGEQVERLARRIVLSLSRGTWGAGKRARNFSELLKRNLRAMAGLAESAAGREARRDFVLACHRCRIWGGLELAERYAQMIVALYAVDRAEMGRSLTCNAVLPLADAILIRDPLFIAGMATSSEQRRHMRQRMNVKLARGDRIERKYLTRLELIGFNRRMRGDLRTSDWPARAVSFMRRFVPGRWRGTRRDRELRDFVMEFVKKAAAGAGQEYEQWAGAMHRLHLQAAENRLRGMAIAEVKMLVQQEVGVRQNVLATESIVGV